MSTLNTNAARWGYLPIALLTLAGCGPSADVQQKLAQVTLVSAQKDSLLQEVADNARLMSEISGDLARVQWKGVKLKVRGETPLVASRDSIVQKIKYVTNKVNESQARLAASQQHIAGLTKLSDSLRSTLTATITNMQAVIDTQKATITALTDQMTTLQNVNAQLVADTVALSHELATTNNTVYYIVGTEDELIKRGIIQKVGGARFLFVLWKQGQTLVPARRMNVADFKAIDKREVKEIELPDPEKSYRIASRQNLEGLATPPDGDGKIVGKLEIAEPIKFWATSKYLILVES